jgi:hypothetical protein
MIILIIWFIWSLTKNLENLIRFTSTIDYYIFSTSGLTPLFFILVASVFLLNVATVYYLFRPRPVGFYIALLALGLSLVQNILSVSLSLSDLPGVKETYAAGREVRGLPVRQEALDAIFTPSSMLMVLAVTLALSAVIAFLLVRNRGHFFRHASRKGVGDTNTSAPKLAVKRGGTQETLGVETVGGIMAPIILQYTPLPCYKSEIFSTAIDGQSSVEIHVLRGNHKLACENTSLGTFSFYGIPPAAKGVPQIEVTFGLDENGIISISAKDLGTGNKLPVTHG